jgi:hypothetical protein
MLRNERLALDTSHNIGRLAAVRAAMAVKGDCTMKHPFALDVRSRHVAVIHGLPLVTGEARDALQQPRCALCNKRSDAVLLLRGNVTRVWTGYRFLQVPGIGLTVCFDCRSFFEAAVARIAIGDGPARARQSSLSAREEVKE